MNDGRNLDGNVSCIARECYELIREEGEVPDLDWIDLRKTDRDLFICYAQWVCEDEKND